MKYVIVTVEWLNSKGVVIQPEWRHNLDNTEYILHEEMVAPLINKDDDIKVYDYDDSDFLNIINGDKWFIEQDNEIV